jgi:hypothetical protein
MHFGRRTQAQKVSGPHWALMRGLFQRRLCPAEPTDEQRLRAASDVVDHFEDGDVWGGR